MKFVIANDIHLSLKAPSSRTDDYTNTILGKMNQLLTLAIKTKAVAILLAGDIFNEKTRVPTLLIYHLLRWCNQVKEAGIRIIAIPGNHDLSNDRYDSLPGQPLGLLFEFGIMEDCSFRTISIGDVAIVGIPYPAAKNRSSWDSLPSPPEPRKIVMGHCFATPTGGEYYGEPMLSYQSLAELPFDVFIFGHDHRDNGIYSVNDKLFINVGGLSRGSQTRENISRDVKCALLEIDGGSPSRAFQIRLNYRPANEVFDLTLRAQKEREAEQIEKFVGQLDSDLIGLDPKNFDFGERVKSMPLSDEVRVRVLAYLEAAEQQ